MSITWKVDRTLLKEPFATDVNDLLDADPGDWFVTCGFRDSAEQKRLHDLYLAGGPKATAPGNSAHECGLAVDVTLVKDGKDDWTYTDADWQRMVHVVVLSPHLHSLGPSIGDWDHIEAVNWRAIRDAVA
jgi:hypothetical protein